jgi:hypothetical protein
MSTSNCCVDRIPRERKYSKVWGERGAALE